MKVITFLNEKGGPGKTTIAGNIAAGLAYMGKNVVIIDADPQAHLTNWMNEAEVGDLYDLLVRYQRTTWRDILTPISTEFWSQESPTDGSLALVRGSSETDSIASQVHKQKASAVVYHRLNQLSEFVDYVIFDTSPQASELHSLILLATDYIIAPTECEAFGALNGLPKTKFHTEDLAQRMEGRMNTGAIAGIIPNKYEDTVLHRQLLGHLQEQYGDLVWDPIGKYIAFGESQIQGLSLFSYMPNSKPASQILNTVKRVMGLGEKENV